MTQIPKAAEHPLSIEEIWNAFMLRHEPQLMTDVLPELETVLNAESETDRQKHIAQYQRTIQLFGEAFKKFTKFWKDAIFKDKERVTKAAKMKAGTEESEILSSIEESFQSS
jgi:hypothetical protein